MDVILYIIDFILRTIINVTLYYILLYMLYYIIYYYRCYIITIYEMENYMKSKTKSHYTNCMGFNHSFFTQHNL